MDDSRTTDPDVIRRCASSILESGALGRSQTNRKLLTYLVDRAIHGEIPKEFDISVDVFGKTNASADAPDTQTRVHIYKLRARLDSYYAGPGKTDAFRLCIPKGTYHVFAVASEHRQSSPPTAHRNYTRWAGYLTLGLLIGSLLVNGWLLRGHSSGDELAKSSVWWGLDNTGRPLVIAVGDHFFFGESGSHIRTRDVAINSKEELRASAEYGSNSGLVFETLSYLPKGTVFALQTLLPQATASGKSVSLKLASEVTPEDLRECDMIYVGFVRAMGILRDHYFSRSNFTAESPLFMSLTSTSSGEVFTRSGPVPQHNRDYGLFARFTGPGGNQIIVFAGIADVGVSAIVRFAGTADGRAAIDEQLAARSLGAPHDFEVLVEAQGHSRTDLGGRIVGAYPLRAARPLLPTPQLLDSGPSGRALPALSAAEQ